MATLQPIRIGDTLSRTYIRKNPDESPMNLTGLTHAFVIKTSTSTHTYEEGQGVTVTDLTGTIQILLTTVQTALLEEDRHANSYLKVTDGSDNIVTRARRHESIIPREEIV